MKRRPSRDDSFRHGYAVPPPSTSPQKNFVFFGDPKEGGKGVSLPFDF